jgi:hypothetical protein
MSQLSTISTSGTQAKCSSRPTTVQESRLLDLPGELRNRTYDLAIQDLEEAASKNPAWRFEMRPPSDISKCAPDPDLDPLPCPPMATSNWSNFNRAYLGLSQTCRTLRTEFLPLHNAVTQATSYIDLPNAAAYITTIGSHTTTTSYHASVRSTKRMSSTTSTLSTIVQNSRLLDLPGGTLLTFRVAPQFNLLQCILTTTSELRNRIYTLAIEDANSPFHGVGSPRS